MKFFSSMTEYYEHIAAGENRLDDIEYTAMRHARDAIAAFDLFVKRNVDQMRQAEFADGRNDEAELIRQLIRSVRAFGGDARTLL